MKLDFEIMQEVGSGHQPSLLHFWDNQAQLFGVNGNRELWSKITNTPNGEWGNREFIADRKISPDENIENFTVVGVFGNIVIGSYRTNDTCKLLVYEY